MKKTLAFLLASSLLLAGCSEGEGREKIAPLRGRLYDASLSLEENLENIDYRGLTSLVEGEEDFALLIYDEDSTCACWHLSFRSTVESYLKERNLLLYGIQMDEFTSAVPDYYGLSVGSDASIALFAEGSLLYQETSETGMDWSEEVDIFTDWMDERIDYSAILEVSKSQLDALFKQNDPFLVMFARSGCSDCSYVEEAVLRENALARKEGFYYLDCDEKGIRYDEEGNLNLDLWESFKDRYGLSAALNSRLGYGEGYVPTWIYYNPSLASSFEPVGMIGDMCVYFNDGVAEVDGTLEIVHSFYSQERISNMTWLLDPDFASHDELYELASSIVGMELSEEDVISSNGAYYLRSSKAASYHNTLLEGFLEYYLS